MISKWANVLKVDYVQFSETKGGNPAMQNLSHELGMKTIQEIY